MDNPVIQTDIADLLGEIRQELKGINDRLGKLEVGQAEIKGELKSIDEKLSGQIKNTDEKLSGQIKLLDEKLSGQKETLDTKNDQLEKRISNQEFFNRIVSGGLVVTILGGIATYFGWIGKP